MGESLKRELYEHTGWLFSVLENLHVMCGDTVVGLMLVSVRRKMCAARATLTRAWPSVLHEDLDNLDCSMSRRLCLHGAILYEVSNCTQMVVLRVQEISI